MDAVESLRPKGVNQDSFGAGPWRGFWPHLILLKRLGPCKRQDVDVLCFSYGFSALRGKRAAKSIVIRRVWCRGTSNQLSGRSCFEKSFLEQLWELIRICLLARPRGCTRWRDRSPLASQLFNRCFHQPCQLKNFPFSHHDGWYYDCGNVRRSKPFVGKSLGSDPR